MDEKVIVVQKKRNEGHIAIIFDHQYPHTIPPTVGDILPIYGVMFLKNTDLLTGKAKQIQITVYDGVYEVLEVYTGKGNMLLQNPTNNLISLNDECSGYGIVVEKQRDLTEVDIDFTVEPLSDMVICLC